MNGGFARLDLAVVYVRLPLFFCEKAGVRETGNDFRAVHLKNTKAALNVKLKCF